MKIEIFHKKLHKSFTLNNISSYKETKTNELLLIKYIKITKLFVTESHHYAQNLKLEYYITAQVDKSN